MRILYYCDEYPPVPHGGIGTVVQIVAEAMSVRGHQVIVAGRYVDQRTIKEDEIRNGVKVIRWYNDSYKTFSIYFASLLSKFFKKRGSAYLNQLKWNRTEHLLNATIKHYNIDIVELPDYINELFKTTNLVSHKLQAPTLARIHGSASFLHYYYYNESAKEKEAQDACHLGRADAICAVSQFSRQFIVKHLLPHRSVDVIYNPIPNTMFENISHFPDCHTIVFFGRVMKSKGVHTLIRAFNGLVLHYPNIKLKIIGDGEIDEAKKIVVKKSENNIEFTGYLQKEDLIKEIDRAMFCVLPSYFENFSMAALEVMARSKALIYTSRASGPELITDGVNGFMVDPDDINALSLRMEQLITNVQLRQQIAENGYHHCRNNFSANIIIPQIETYYQNLVLRCTASHLA